MMGYGRSESGLQATIYEREPRVPSHRRAEARLLSFSNVPQATPFVELAEGMGDRRNESGLLATIYEREPRVPSHRRAEARLLSFSNVPQATSLSHRRAEGAAALLLQDSTRDARRN
jgi:hypothetical protein